MDAMKRAIEIAGISCFTKKGYESFFRVSKDFLEEVLRTTVTYMEHCRSMTINEKYVAYAFQRLNLKVYGLEMDAVDWEEEDEESYDKEDKQVASTSCTCTEGTSAISAREMEDDDDEDDVGCDEDEEDDDDDDDEIEDEDHDDDCGEDMIAREEEEEEFGSYCEDIEHDDKEDKQVASTSWTCTEGIFFELGDAVGPRPTRVFSRKQVKEMCTVILYSFNYNLPVTQAALLALHQVFEDYILHQFNDIIDDRTSSSKLRLEIRNQVLAWRVSNLEEENKGLKEKAEKRKRLRESGESLQPHFDIIDLTGAKRRRSLRRVSP